MSKSIMHGDWTEDTFSNESGLKRLRIHETSDDFLGFIVVNGAYMYASCIPTREAAERIVAIYEEPKFYNKPKKRFKVFPSGKYYAVYNVIGSRYCIAEEIHSQEAAERIAFIYEEDTP